jgi:hypothetical protein
LNFAILPFNWFFVDNSFNSVVKLLLASCFWKCFGICNRFPHCKKWKKWTDILSISTLWRSEVFRTEFCGDSWNGWLNLWVIHEMVIWFCGWFMQWVIGFVCDSCNGWLILCVIHQNGCSEQWTIWGSYPHPTTFWKHGTY